MIKDFETYIRESRLGRILNNSFSDTVRREDDYVAINLVDELPFYIADKDVHYDGKDKFTFEELELMKNHIERDGWRIPSYDEMGKLRDIEGTSKFNTDDNTVFVSCSQGGLRFGPVNLEDEDIEARTLDINYWSLYSKIDTERLENPQTPQDRVFVRNLKKNARGFYIRTITSRESTHDWFHTTNIERTERCRIRLIKDKK